MSQSMKHVKSVSIVNSKWKLPDYISVGVVILAFANTRNTYDK